MIRFRYLFLALLLSGCALEPTIAAVRRQFPDVRQVSIDRARKLLNAPPGERPILLDVREPGEFGVSHLPGAVRAATLAEAIAQIEGEPTDREILAYCSVGYRSSALVEELARAGYTNAANIEGSIFAWANAGLPVERHGEPVAGVHPFSVSWGLTLDWRRWAWQPGSD